MSKTGSAAKVKLNSFDDLFGSSGMQTVGSEQIINAPLAELYDFKNHPFRVVDDEKMEETTESICQYGVLVPGIARPRTGGGYELIAGHRRKRGSQRAGKLEMPVIVRNYSDDEATIIMVDSNIQREDILPSEKAKAYKMKYEAMEKFGLQLEDSKSRLLQSGAYIARAKQKSGECIRLQTFDFLGFTFYCGRSRKGMPYIMPKTSSKKFRQKIRDIKVWLYANRDQPLKKLMGMLNLKLIGHYRYYGISFNGRMISNYKQQVRELLFKVLNRRSDRKSYTREGFIEMLKYYPLAMPKIYVSLF